MSRRGRITKARFEALMRNKDWRVRLEGVEEIGTEEGATELLIAALQDEESQVKATAVKMLGKTGDSSAVKPLTELLSDSDAFVRGAAAKALGELESEESLEGLYQVLHDDDMWVRDNAVRAMGSIGSPTSVDVLSQALDDPEPTVVISCIDSLSVIGNPSAVSRLVPLLVHSDELVVEYLKESFERIGSDKTVGPLILALESDDPRMIRSVKDSLLLIGEDAIPPLIDSISVGDEQIIASCAEILAGLEAAQAVRPLVECLQRPLRYETMESVIDALTSLLNGRLEGFDEFLQPGNHELNRALREVYIRSGEPALESLVSLMHSDDLDTRLMAIDGLALLGSRNALDPLYDMLLKDIRWQVVDHVHSALTRLDGISEKVLRNILKDEEGKVRIPVLRILGMTGDAAILRELTDVLEGDRDWTVYLALKEVFLSRSEDAVPILIDLVKVQNVVQRDFALGVLESIGEPALVSLLKALEEFDDITTVLAARLLRDWQEPKALPALINRMNDTGSWMARSSLERVIRAIPSGEAYMDRLTAGKGKAEGASPDEEPAGAAETAEDKPKVTEEGSAVGGSEETIAGFEVMLGEDDEFERERGLVQEVIGHVRETAESERPRFLQNLFESTPDIKEALYKILEVEQNEDNLRGLVWVLGEIRSDEAEKKLREVAVNHPHLESEVTETLARFPKVMARRFLEREGPLSSEELQEYREMFTAMKEVVLPVYLDGLPQLGEAKLWQIGQIFSADPEYTGGEVFTLLKKTEHVSTRKSLLTVMMGIDSGKSSEILLEEIVGGGRGQDYDRDIYRALLTWAPVRTLEKLLADAQRTKHRREIPEIKEAITEREAESQGTEELDRLNRYMGG